jgi:hypothetical protein
MAHLRVTIALVDDQNASTQVTELQRMDLPALDARQLAPATALDALETQAVQSGQEVMRHLLCHQWQVVDEQLAAEILRLSPPGNDHRGWLRHAQGRNLGGDPLAAPADAL